MSNDYFLKGALARYKGFLHLIRRNREKSLKRFCVPTYDIDLIWHSHQLNPVSYCKDLNEVLGKILEHDDTDADRTKGMKLDVGFSGTTKQWEETFGTRYWRAGAMYRGSTPTPITNTPFSSSMIKKEIAASNEHQKIIELPEVKSVEVCIITYPLLFFSSFCVNGQMYELRIELRQWLNGPCLFMAIHPKSHLHSSYTRY